MTRTPSRSEVERAWVMRQFQLDEEAGRETDSLEYSREFRNFWKAETDAAYERGKRAAFRKEHVQRHNHTTRDLKPYGQCPACDATRDAWKHAADREGASE